MTINIPQVIEGYSDVRIVWFGQGATITTIGETGAQSSEDAASDAFYQLAGIKANEDGGIELSTNGESDIASMSWNKDTQSPAGVLGLSLLPRKDYLNLMTPNDVLVIYANGRKHTSETFLALVSIDTIDEMCGVDGNGAPTTTVSIQARDLGKILMETPTVYDAAFGGVVMARFYTQFGRAFVKGTAQGGPSLVVQTMLSIFFSLRQNFVTRAIGQVTVPYHEGNNGPAAPLQPWRFPGNPQLSMFSLLDTTTFVQETMVGQLIADASLLQNASNLWQLCEMYANKLVNEFFIDTRDLVPNCDAAHKRMSYYAARFIAKNGGDPTAQEALIEDLANIASLSDQTANELTEEAVLANDIDQRGKRSVIALVHRQLPYDTFSFYALPTSIVFETETFSRKVGYSSADIVNMFRIRFPGLAEGVNLDLQYGVAINRQSIERHGIKRFEGESIYVWFNTVGPDGSVVRAHQPAYEFYQSLLTTWNAYNDRLMSGSISMGFRPDIRAGTRLTFVRTRNGRQFITDFYVQRVSHSYAPDAGGSSTSVDLVRGVNRDGLSVQADAESHLFWTDEGGSLNPNPYEVVQGQDTISHMASKPQPPLPSFDLEIDEIDVSGAP